MSSISSTQAGFGLAQLLQNIVANTSAANSNSSTESATTTPSTGVSGHHRPHGGGFAKLADAISNALQSASGNITSGTSTTDPNQTITQALEKIFKNGSLGSTTGTDDDDDSTASPTTTTPASTTLATNNAAPASPSSTTSSLPASFVQTLQSFGVTAQQFQTDLSNALKNAVQSGSVDVSNVFKSFPIGSAVDSIG